ncbi:hypothetical protein L873DRAFT_19152 [Choiromyces venosus 120613-1]|uniref:Uncharacterized protein n=1 Tax=Choiromyces venosus 120613-1 TaxID=1336337 RepID=A0A3N4K6N0_9PEZI|nr:hypothetical protein L873DRAFT_19152 [Choiromyces venosus 120613-1]
MTEFDNTIPKLLYWGRRIRSARSFDRCQPLMSWLDAGFLTSQLGEPSQSMIITMIGRTMPKQATVLSTIESLGHVQIQQTSELRSQTNLMELDHIIPRPEEIYWPPPNTADLLLSISPINTNTSAADRYIRHVKSDKQKQHVATIRAGLEICPDAFYSTNTSSVATCCFYFADFT